ncbi:hypothetical protein [Acaryochloris thomasi]|uniref:hypothetical protein n=1 Tax=Acaryochloris thomasi TaxID=2929456 RepID=UPI0011B4A577|nr:hypothetical protein [Acaryochloris thomasi]
MAVSKNETLGLEAISPFKTRNSAPIQESVETSYVGERQRCRKQEFEEFMFAGSFEPHSKQPLSPQARQNIQIEMP